MYSRILAVTKMVVIFNIILRFFVNTNYYLFNLFFKSKMNFSVMFTWAELRVAVGISLLPALELFSI